ncbi:MAG TPA: CHAT domain-containing tetratricopeptide repeat protein [Actinomycetota bacterium]|nr:CHAT domain-containing tetratricopeptide repeat protein [Actinomycetota bacterium]
MAEAVERGADALRRIQEALGPEHPLVGDVLNAMGAAYVALDDAAAADRSYRQALTIRRNAFGEDHPGVADVLAGMGDLFRKAKRYDGAEIMHRTALGIRRDALGERHRAVADSLFDLGLTLFESGDLVAPEALFKEALDILRDTDGDRAPSYANCLSNLASLYGTTGDWATSERMDKEALDIRREALGRRHPDVASSLNNLAGLYRTMEDFEAALPLYLEALEIRREVVPANDPDLAASLSNLGVLYHAMGDFAAAEPLHREALEIRRGAYGPRNTWVGISLECLGALLRDLGDHAASEALLREALEIHEQNEGDSHPLVGQCLTDLSFLYVRTERATEGLTLLRRVADIHDRYLRQVVAAGTERRRMGFLSRMETSLERYVSLVVGDFGDDHEAVGSALDLVLRRKGLAAEILAAERDAILGGGYPDLAPKLEELTGLRTRITQMSLAGPGPEGARAHRQALEETKARKEVLEQQLAGAIPELGLEERLRETDRRAVAAALPRGSVLVEFLKFDFIDFRAIKDWRKPARYVAFVLRDGEPGEVAMVDLGDAAAIDGLIAAYRWEITLEVEEERGRGTRRGSGQEASAGGSSGAGTQLREAVFDPLREHLRDRERLFLSPDGDLSRLPFEVLPEEGGFLVDRYAISYVSTGRDTLRFGVGSGAQATDPVVAADPLFDLTGGPPGTPSPGGRRSSDLSRAGLAFERLAGTRDEGDAVARALGIAPWVEGDVLEARVKACRSPRILHVATHGFFLPDQGRTLGGTPAGIEAEAPIDEAGPMRGPGLENPLLRSGLALAGANTFLSGLPLPPDAEDGILTAEDVSGLDLLGTEMVVLSACETGLGEVRRGEGVFGLRRAFVLAGAKSLVMSLWKVPDEETRRLMGAFYRGVLVEGLSRSEALGAAQRELARDQPDPWYWGAFILQGDPGPLALDRRDGGGPSDG